MGRLTGHRKSLSNVRTVTPKRRIRNRTEIPIREVSKTRYEECIHKYRMFTVDFFSLLFFFFTLYPVTSPGSQTAAETSFTSKSCTSPMLSPMFSKPSWRTLREGTSTFTSKPRTLPKLRRNCTTMRQSENVLPSRTRPGMRGNSGKGWKVKKNSERFSTVFQKRTDLVLARETADTSVWPTAWQC